MVELHPTNLHPPRRPTLSIIVWTAFWGLFGTATLWVIALTQNWDAGYPILMIVMEVIMGMSLFTLFIIGCAVRGSGDGGGGNPAGGM